MNIDIQIIQLITNFIETVAEEKGLTKKEKTNG